jgi:hypothetical protein
MWRWALVLVGCASLAAPALGGPNAGGTLVVHDADLPISAVHPAAPLCGQGNVPTICAALDTRLDGSGPGSHQVWKIYAAFPSSSSPRLMGLEFGIDYDPNLLVITGEATRSCGDFELPDLEWPGPHAGNSVVWSSVQTSRLVPIYAFSGYALGPTSFSVIPNPSDAGIFGDDSAPSVMDYVAGYGRLGFDTDGAPRCEMQLGACCRLLGNPPWCALSAPDACVDGSFHGGMCDPDPCLIPTTTTILSHLPDPSFVGQTVTVFCEVQEGRGASAPGTVTVTDGIDSCTGPVQSECVLHLSTPGLRTLTATYSPLYGFLLPSTSPGVVQRVCGPPLTGACCLTTGGCSLLQRADCVASAVGGIYRGDCGPCDPNPCPAPVPAQQSTWGRIKSSYR